MITLSGSDLSPISYAIEDPDLKKEVEAAISEYIRASKSNVTQTVPLLQNSNGRIYRYVTSYDESLQLENRDNLKAYGMLGALYRNKTGESIPSIPTSIPMADRCSLSSSPPMTGNVSAT